MADETPKPTPLPTVTAKDMENLLLGFFKMAFPNVPLDRLNLPPRTPGWYWICPRETWHGHPADAWQIVCVVRRQGGRSPGLALHPGANSDLSVEETVKRGWTWGEEVIRRPR